MSSSLRKASWKEKEIKKEDEDELPSEQVRLFHDSAVEVKEEVKEEPLDEEPETFDDLYEPLAADDAEDTGNFSSSSNEVPVVKQRRKNRRKSSLGVKKDHRMKKNIHTREPYEDNVFNKPSTSKDSNNVEPYQKEKRVVKQSKIQTATERRSKQTDEEDLIRYKIPFTVQYLIEVPIKEFNQLPFSLPQMEVAKRIRRRGRKRITELARLKRLKLNPNRKDSDDRAESPEITYVYDNGSDSD